MAKGKSIKNLSEKPVKEKRPFGGPQPGSGRPKGSLGLKARTLLEVKNRIAQKADDIINAELVDALGSFIVLKLDPESEKYLPVTDPQEITRAVNAHNGVQSEGPNNVYIVTSKPGNYKARQYLLDRAFGRPTQAVEVSDDPELARVKALIEARAQEKGIDYAEELRNYIERYAPEPIREQLTRELVQLTSTRPCPTTTNYAARQM